MKRKPVERVQLRWPLRIMPSEEVPLERHMNMSGGRLTVEVQPPDNTTGAFQGVWLFGTASQEMEGIWDGAKGFLVLALVTLFALCGPLHPLQAAPLDR